MNFVNKLACHNYRPLV